RRQALCELARFVALEVADSQSLKGAMPKRWHQVMLQDRHLRGDLARLVVDRRVNRKKGLFGEFPKRRRARPLIAPLKSAKGGSFSYFFAALLTREVTAKPPRSTAKWREAHARSSASVARFSSRRRPSSS